MTLFKRAMTRRTKVKSPKKTRLRDEVEVKWNKSEAKKGK